MLPQAWQQMKDQTKKSSSIIVALTDGKLSPFILELTIKEVRSYRAEQSRGRGKGGVHRVADIAFIFLYLSQALMINDPFCLSFC